jgi:hypothetical protein
MNFCYIRAVFEFVEGPAFRRSEVPDYSPEKQKTEKTHELCRISHG